MNSSDPQLQTPIIDTLHAVLKRGIIPIHTPGHKGGAFSPDSFKRIVGKKTLMHDVPSWELTDNMFNPSGCIKRANELAADLYGAAETRLLTSGSTIGIAAMVLSSVKPGDTILLPRNVHQSVYSALVLSGAKPRFLMPFYSRETGASIISPAQILHALQEDSSIKAVLLTRPTYYGLAAEMDEVSKICDQFNIILLIDEAHGAHLKYLPSGSPKQALDFGADLVVQSPHKTINAMVGGALLHIGKKSPIPVSRVQAMLNILQTTSPSYLVLASLDACRAMLAREGNHLYASAVNNADSLRLTIENDIGLKVLRQESIPEHLQCKIDPLRLVVHVGTCGVTGYEAQSFLRKNFKVEPELCDSYNLVFVLTPIERKGAYVRLLKGLTALRKQSQKASVDTHSIANDLPLPQSALTPREAAFAEKERLPLEQSIGRICGETISFYPPGIPVLISGEVINRRIVDICKSMLRLGAHSYASDSSLRSIMVIHE